MSTMINLPVTPAFKNNNLTITLQTSDYFAPYASVMVLSILEHASPDYNYDILIMTWDMHNETEQKFLTLAKGRTNISIRVVDVSNSILKYDKIARKRKDYERFSATGIIRLMLPELLANYDIVLNLDCDMLVCADVAELFRYDLTNYYMGGVPDIICYVCNRRPEEKQFTNELLFKKLKLDKVSDYFNGGLLYLNLKKIREDFSTEQIMAFAQSDGTFFTCYEQDTFNGLFRGKKLALPMEWNWMIDTGNMIKNLSVNYPVNDYYIKLYNQASKFPRNIHYVGLLKPWKNSDAICSRSWWKTAMNSPFVSEIVDKITGKVAPKKEKQKIHTKYKQTKERRILFFAETRLQLINAINIKRSFLQKTPADIILCKNIELEQYTNSTKKSAAFDEIITAEYCEDKDYNTLLRIPLKVRTLYPEKYVKVPPIDNYYTDFFITNPESIYQKMLYYCMIKKGMHPLISIYEGGQTTYTDDAQWKLSLGLDHSVYPNNARIYNNLINIYIYQPELYCGQASVPQIIIPKVNTRDEMLFDLYSEIFGSQEQIKEKYIFLQEDFFGKGQLSDDTKALDVVSNIVGKDNITVKLQNDSARDIYRNHGYRVLDSDFPIELAALRRKVLMSVSSDFLLTAHTMFDEEIISISFVDIMRLGVRSYIDSPEYRHFMFKARKEYNKTSQRLFHPLSMRELGEVVKYIEGEM